MKKTRLLTALAICISLFIILAVWPPKIFSQWCCPNGNCSLGGDRCTLYCMCCIVPGGDFCDPISCRCGHCNSDNCEYDYFGVIGCGGECGGGSGGCFTPDTKIDTPEGEKEIKDIKVGDEVKSLIPDTGEETLSKVEDVHEVSQSAYYRIKTKDGKELKVTAEHPLWAIQSSDAESLADKKEPLNFWEYFKTESLTKKFFDLLLDKP